jgi:hypothetical protein
MKINIKRLEGNMAYCAICGTDHSPEYPCSGLAGDKLHEMGLNGGPGKSKEEFRRLEKKADRYMLKIALIAIAIFTFVIVVNFIRGNF